MSRASSWRLALRIARRDALRHRGRTLLMLVMIALPVLAVTAADVVISTQDVDSVESLDRRLGDADALVSVPSGGAPMLQAADPDQASTTVGDAPSDVTPPSASAVAAVLGGGHLVERRDAETDLRTDDGITYVETTELDLDDPVARSLYTLTSGRWPRDRDEVVVGRAVLDQGYAVGDRLGLDRDGLPRPVIVGVVQSPESRSARIAVGPIGSLGVDVAELGGPSWLVSGTTVNWSTVERLNALGATVLSRAVITDPPPTSEVPAEIRSWNGGDNADEIAVAVLVVVMALLEVVLLAGPAFAVTARRQARTLALMAASGGTPAQSRRVIVGVGVVVGSVAAAAGVVLGIVVAVPLVPLVQRFNDTRFGPFDVPWLHLAGIALFGLASAVLASVVPAWIASRQDVVAVLAGRRADKRPSLRSPVLGVVLLGAGIALSAYGATSPSGEYAIAASAVVAILGMILLVPVVVVGLARLVGRLPLSTRYAARDAARHRTRTVPAVAAVAATVAGVVALGIAVTTDEASNRESYHRELPMDTGTINVFADEAPVDWAGLRAAAQRELPRVPVVPVVGVPEGGGEGVPSYWIDLSIDGRDPVLSAVGGSMGSATLVGPDSLDRLPWTLPPARRSAAAAGLARGGVVVFTDRRATGDRVELTVHQLDPGAEQEQTRQATLPAVVVPVPPGTAGPAAVVPTAVAHRLKVPVRTVSLVVTAPISSAQEEAAAEALRAVDRNASLYVERGYQTDSETLVIQLVLAALGAVLMLGGTLTATFLALSDARPDLATLSAIGASPRRRRSIAASYALVVGFVGALLGAAVGFIPGIAITYPLTRGYGDGAAHYLDVPWLMILGLVVGLPVLTAAVVGLAARSRLPLVARLD